jgi:hypothetical protein
VEWFDKVDGFDVLDTSPFAAQPDAAGLLKRLHQQAKSIVNFGFGYQRKVSDGFSYYGAFTTDFTFANKDDFATNSSLHLGHLPSDGRGVLPGGDREVDHGRRLFLRERSPLDHDPRRPSGGRPGAHDHPLDVSYSRFRVLVGFDFGR